MSSHLERYEKDAFESFRHLGELHQKIMEGLEQRRALAERFGRDNLFRSYLLYACDSLKCVKAQADWTPLSEGIVDELGTSFVYKREVDSTQLSAHSPHAGHIKQEFDVDDGIWRWCETQPIFEEIPTESQYQNLEVQKEKAQWQNTFNREVELVLRRRHPHLNHPDSEWRDVLEFPVIELLRQYRRLSGK